MLGKLVVLICFMAAGIQAKPRRLPVPSRLVYGPTVPISEAAAALGHAASMPNGIVTNTVADPHRAPQWENVGHWAGVRANAIVAQASASAGGDNSGDTREGFIIPATSAQHVKLSQYGTMVPIGTRQAFGGNFEPSATYETPQKSFRSAQSYSFGYDSIDEQGNRQSRTEQGDVNNFKTGSYSFTDADGISRRVDYVADHGGFRASINTNEPGTAPSAPAAALYSDAIVHRRLSQLE